MKTQKLTREEKVNEVEKEAGLTKQAVVEAEVSANKAKPKANEFNDEYTLQVIFDNENADIFRIPNPDPNFSYRFLQVDDKNMARKTSNLLTQQGGWQVCPSEHCARIGFDKNILTPDGSYRIGEHVLAFMPMGHFEKKEQAKAKKANARMEQINRMIKKGDPSVGATDMHETMKGIQPAHKLGFKTQED